MDWMGGWVDGRMDAWMGRWVVYGVSLTVAVIQQPPKYI